MKGSLRNCTALAVIISLCVLFINPSSASTLSSIRPVTQARPVVEGRSLLDFLLGGPSDGNSATSLKGPSTSSSPIIDLATALLGKDNVNTKLYIKIFKLIFNLFMDVMADRMDEAKRREDISPSSFNLFKSKFILKEAPLYERQAQSILKRQQMYKPYFVE